MDKLGIDSLLNSSKDLFHYSWCQCIGLNEDQIPVFVDMFDLFLCNACIHGSIAHQKDSLEYNIDKLLTIHDLMGIIRIAKF